MNKGESAVVGSRFETGMGERKRKRGPGYKREEENNTLPFQTMMIPPSPPHPEVDIRRGQRSLKIQTERPNPSLPSRPGPD